MNRLSTQTTFEISHRILRTLFNDNPYLQYNFATALKTDWINQVLQINGIQTTHSKSAGSIGWRHDVVKYNITSSPLYIQSDNISKKMLKIRFPHQISLFSDIYYTWFYFTAFVNKRETTASWSPAFRQKTGWQINTKCLGTRNSAGYLWNPTQRYDIAGLY